MIYDLTLPSFRLAFWQKKPGWERERLQAMCAVAKEGDTIIDIGAEIGDMTALLAQKAGKTGKMIVIEPVEKAWPIIRYIFEHNDLKTPYCFVGFAGNEVKNNPDMYMSSDWPECSAEPMPDGEPGFQHLDERYDMPQVTIDYLNLRKLDVMTMDTEGSEFEVIKGATETIKRLKPVIFISIHPAFMDARYKQQPNDLINYIKEFGYSCELLAVDHEVHAEFKPL